MSQQTLEQQLADLRARISQLQVREAALALEVEGARTTPRPGWPIRRVEGALH